MRRERVVREKERALERARAVVNRRFDEDGEEEKGERKRGAGVEEGGSSSKKTKVDGGEDAVAGETSASQPEPTDSAEAMDVDSPAPAKKKRGRISNKDKALIQETLFQEIATSQNIGDTSTPTRATRSSAPKTRKEAFNALAAGAPASASKTKGKGKGKGKAK